MGRAFLLGLLGFLLGACSVLPIPVDLLPYLGKARTGERSFPVPPGEATFELKLPNEEGLPVDFTQANVPIRIGYASLEWALDLLLQGVQATGDLAVQLYLAPYETWDPFQQRYELGKPVRARMVTGQRVTLAGSASLDGDQLDVLNAKKLRLGMVLSANLSAKQSGELTLFYGVTRAVLKVGLF